MKGEHTQLFEISTGTIIRFFGVLFGILVIYLTLDILAALFFAIIIASALEPGILWLKERKIPRIFSVLLFYLLFAAMLFLLVYMIFPVISEEFHNFYSLYPQLEEKIVSEIERLGIFSYFGGDVGSFLSTPLQYIGKLNSIFDFASAVFGGVTTFFLVFLFSFYLAAQERGIEGFLRLVIPLKYESYVLDLWKRAQRKLGLWFRTQLLLGALVGILIFFALTFLGVPQAFLLAIIAGMFEIIPIVGPILAAVPGVIIAFFISPAVGLTTLILYVVVQQLESHVIVPVVMRKTVDLSPLIIVIALLVGAKLGGIFGILLSVPITAILAELLNDWDKKKREIISG